MDTTIYVGTYWNQHNDPVRKSITEQMMTRYPWINVIQGYYEDSDELLQGIAADYKLDSILKDKFVDYILINKYLSNISFDFPNGFNLVVIDLDLILPDNFRTAMESALEVRDFVHGFEECIMSGEKVTKVPSFYVNGRGHSGYVQGFGHRYMKAINYKFMENFTAGGFDYINALIMNNKSIDLYNKFTFYKELLEFKDKLTGLSSAYLEGISVEHHYHGPANKRLTPFKVYNECNHEDIEEFCRSRACCE